MHDRGVEQALHRDLGGEARAALTHAAQIPVNDPLLLVPATHLWLLLASPELRPRRVGAIALVAGGLLPLILLVAFYGHQLGLGVMVAFLASDVSAYTTGTIITIDGGAANRGPMF